MEGMPDHLREQIYTVASLEISINLIWTVAGKPNEQIESTQSPHIEILG